MPGPYEGVHAHAFLFSEDKIPVESTIENLQRLIDRENGPVFYAGLCEGAFQGFVHVAADDVPAVGELVDGPARWGRSRWRRRCWIRRSS